MKRLLLILLTFMSLNVFAQIQVKEGSFKKIEGYLFLDKHDHTDMNDAPMAVIKISTEYISAEQRRKFTFEGGNLITYVDGPYFEPSEMLLYISAQAATSLVIKHDDYGKTEFVFPYDLCDFCGYEMVIQYVPMAPAEPAKAKQKYHLIVTAEQDNALIYIDDKEPEIKEASQLFEEGSTHTWRIECNMYHTESGTVTINEKTIINKDLRPNFGYINVTTSPESGAKVFVDGEYLGLSPIKTDKLKSGSHTVRVMKDMYKMKEQSFVVNDGQTTNATLNMAANFVNVTINTDIDSDIYVDEEYKAKGKWTGRLSDGSHIFEARKTNHKSSSMNVELVLGENKTFALEYPAPINGSCEINTSPMGAEIYIDGKHYGQTPNYINEILIGTHELKLEKQGCSPITRTITIRENETLSINEKLQTGKEISISTDQYGDKIYVDGSYLGTSPLTSNLSYGSHAIKAIRDGKEVSKTITVSQYGGDNSVKLTFKQEINGHEYVDLGLSVKWATCNVGANKPEDYGDYYAWGETKTKSEYWDDNSVTYGKSFSDIKGDSRYDAARANWGGSWRLPTKKEYEELVNRCTWKWMTQNGVKGYKVTGPNGNSIFLPAAGYRFGSSLNDAGEYGYYWSSTPYESDSYDAYYLSFDSGDHYVNWYSRSHGLSVRPVTE